MNQKQWTAVDKYITDLFVPSDTVLDEALIDADRAGLPPHNVAPNQGKLLWLFATIHKARRILEIGTLGGYSTIWLARAVPPGGTVVTLEANPQHAAVAGANITRASLADVVEVRVGPALDILPQLAGQGSEPFDLVFIDADKPNNPDYLAWAIRLSRPGTLIIADNVVRNGAIADADSGDPAVQGIRRFNELLAADPRLSATALQTVGSKGYDGFAIAVVLHNDESA